MRTKIINARVITQGKEFDRHTIVVENDKIEAVLPATAVGDGCFDQIIDAKGAYASAGFIDLHTHGIGGYDFMDAEGDGVLNALRMYARFGVTGVYPTTMSAPFVQVRAALDSLAKVDFTIAQGAAFLGAHLEGPYFSPAQCGAQPPDQLCAPSDEEYKKLINEYSFVRRIDAAPELSGSMQMAKDLALKGVISGIAHTDADAQTTLLAADAGYRIATHLYSGMSGVHRENGFRKGGVVEACLLRDDVYCEAICDGIHLPAELLKLIYKVKGADRMILVTDSMRGAGLKEGSRCVLGNKDTGTPVVIAEGVAWLPDRSAFAGSVATYDVLIRKARDYAHIPLPDVIKMASETPARAMRLSNKGVLAAGYDADITLFDENIEIQLTMVGGKTQYER
ncbi:MAG: N-acetylglucosamine-6-phosphate deacetylase [Clostridiales bacterium]|nr:N-acetylglucosamine-6-phosphate deacetylase [Clostridiales bacterium]